jgi:hypothetical protein
MKNWQKALGIGSALYGFGGGFGEGGFDLSNFGFGAKEAGAAAAEDEAKEGIMSKILGSPQSLGMIAKAGVDLYDIKKTHDYNDRLLANDMAQKKREEDRQEKLEASMSNVWS